MMTHSISEEAKEFWEGVARSELWIQRCDSCRKHVFFPREYCPYDMGTLTYEQVSGRGKILTYSIVERTGDPDYTNLTPYVAAIVQLEEGPTMFTRIVGTDPYVVTFNDPVEVVFIHEGDKKIPLFRPLQC